MSALDAIDEAIEALDTIRQNLSDDGDTEAVANLLHDIAGRLAPFKQLYENIEADLFNMLPQESWEIPGLGVVEKRYGTKRNEWDWDALLPKLIATYVDPAGGGELPDAAEVVERMTALIVETIGVTASKGPRVKPLRDLGFQVDEWCTEKPGRQSIQIHTS